MPVRQEQANTEPTASPLIKTSPSATTEGPIVLLPVATVPLPLANQTSVPTSAAAHPIPFANAMGVASTAATVRPLRLGPLGPRLARLWAALVAARLKGASR